MGHPRKSLQHQLRRGAIALSIAGAFGWSSAVVLNHTQEQVETWTQCFEDEQTASIAGHSVAEARITVQAERRADQRRIQAHERALLQLSGDRRWEDPEQRPWLELAVEQTNAQITDLRAFELEAEDTEGCLESFD